MKKSDLKSGKRKKINGFFIPKHTSERELSIIPETQRKSDKNKRNLLIVLVFFSELFAYISLMQSLIPLFLISSFLFLVSLVLLIVEVVKTKRKKLPHSQNQNPQMKENPLRQPVYAEIISSETCYQEKIDKKDLLTKCWIGNRLGGDTGVVIGALSADRKKVPSGQTVTFQVEYRCGVIGTETVSADSDRFYELLQYTKQ